MRFSDPWRLALLNAGIVTLTYILFQGVYICFHPIHSWVAVFSTLAMFLLSFLVLRYTLERHIYTKIRIIYKLIRTQKSPKKENVPRIDRIMLDQVEHEVTQWNLQHNLEIEELKKMAAYRREFLGNISHELKTPIFNVQGYVLTLLDGGLEDPAINREYLHRTEKSINRLIAMVDDLEVISRLESGEVRLKYISFDMAGLCREVAEILEHRILKYQVEVKVAGSPSKPVMVYADREKIEQVLTNLLDNAIKYSKPGGNINIRFFEMDDRLLTEVSDDGIGIEEGNLPRLFERFYRTDKARSREDGGSGLGLAIVKHILEAHGQTVHVRSTPGIGTTFGFTLNIGK